MSKATKAKRDDVNFEVNSLGTKVTLSANSRKGGQYIYQHVTMTNGTTQYYEGAEGVALAERTKAQMEKDGLRVYWGKVKN